MVSDAGVKFRMSGLTGFYYWRHAIPGDVLNHSGDFSLFFSRVCSSLLGCIPTCFLLHDFTTMGTRRFFIRLYTLLVGDGPLKGSGWYLVLDPNTRTISTTVPEILEKATYITMQPFVQYRGPI